MHSIRVARRLVFGFRGDVGDNIAYADDGSVVYPAGHNVVLYSADTRTQRLIPGTLESDGISAICVSSNKKLLAVAERSEKAMITVYDLQTLKRRKVLMSTDAGSKVRQVLRSALASTAKGLCTAVQQHRHPCALTSLVG